MGNPHLDPIQAKARSRHTQHNAVKQRNPYDHKRKETKTSCHVMREEKYEILRLIIERKILGKISIGRRQYSWLKAL